MVRRVAKKSGVNSIYRERRTMAKKIHFTAQQENEIALIQEETGMSRRSAIRKLQRRARLAAKQAKAPKVAKPIVKSFHYLHGASLFRL